jgi:hypothetical protein
MSTFQNLRMHLQWLSDYKRRLPKYLVKKFEVLAPALMKNSGLIRCDAVWLGECVRLLGLLDPDGVGTTIVRNVRKYRTTKRNSPEGLNILVFCCLCQSMTAPMYAIFNKTCQGVRNGMLCVPTDSF